MHTLEFVAKQWFEVKRTKVNPNFAFDIWRSLELHVFPDLGKLAINKITAQDAIATIKKLEDQGKLESVKRVCQRLNEIMVFAVKPNESAGTRWDEIDFDNQLWVIPGDRMKKGKALTVPLSPQAMAILENIKPISQNSPFVFPADRSPKKQINQQAANAALVTMGFKDQLVAHGLRALASTTLNEQGFDPDIIESALAHKDKNQIRRAYNRAEYLEQRRVMMC